MTQYSNQPLSICLLGEFSLTKGGQLITTLNAERPQSLLAYLLLHLKLPISRQRLAYTFWPNTSDEQARTNLRNLLHTLRRNLPDADSYLLLDTHTIQWHPDAVFRLDVIEFQEALDAAKQAEEWFNRQQYLESAISLYKGVLLPGIYDDWLIPIREELYQSYLEALRQLAYLLAEMGDYQAAVHYARLWQRQDPLTETAVILLMQLYAHIGDQAAVHLTYQTCVTALREELDAEPATETQSAYNDALRRAAADDEPSELKSEASVMLYRRSSPRQAQQLPRQSTLFIGREEELAKLAEWLADPYCRLITINGPGGIGKTRLALQVAYGHVTVFANGAAFVSLAAVTNPAILPSVIANGLQFPFTTTSSRKAQLLQYLADKELLLVLDNLEQLDDKTEFLAEILRTAPKVKIVVTSRQHLNLQEEWGFHLHGLPLPDIHDLQNVADNSAVALFLYLTQRYNANFVPNEEDMKAISRICQLVNGIPLALELAAPWIRLLSCVEIGEEIDKNLDFLTSSQRDIPRRHRSMRAVFNQSWETLTQSEKIVFSCLSLFAGGFSREGAEKVAGATLDILSNLLDKSLVYRLANGRYDIHALLRQYAANQLAATLELLMTAYARFTTYYVTLAEVAIPQLVGPEQQTWLAKLDLEYDNLRALLSWALQKEDVETAVRLAAALGRYWWLRHYPIEGSNWLSQILALPGPQTEFRARAMSYAGMLARLRHDYPEAEAWLTKSIQYQAQASNKQDLGRSLNELGMVYMDQDQFHQAQQLFEEWLALARELEFQHGISIALLNLGMVAHHQGNLSQAETYFQESLSLSRQFGLKTNIALVLNSFSMLILDQNKVESSRDLLLESVYLNLDLNHKDGLSWAFLGLVTLYYRQGELETAACLAGVHETLRRSFGVPLPPANQHHFENILSDLLQKLGYESFTTQIQRGREMPLNTALALVQKQV